MVSGFQENGGGGEPLSGFSTFVQDVTERVLEVPGSAVPPDGLREIEPGTHAGRAAVFKP